MSSIELSETEEWKEDVRQLVLLARKLVPILCISIGARLGQWCKYTRPSDILMKSVISISRLFGSFDYHYRHTILSFVCSL